MKVSFTGIENLSIYVDKNPKKAYYKLKNQEKIQTTADYHDVVLNCDLTDDEEGNHLGDLYKVFQTSRNYYTNASDPRHLEVSIVHSNIYTPYGNIPKDEIKFNSYPINLESGKDRELLPFYTYIAKILNEIMQMNDNDDLNEVLQNSNNIISKHAEHFIDEIM